MCHGCCPASALTPSLSAASSCRNWSVLLISHTCPAFLISRSCVLSERKTIQTLDSDRRIARLFRMPSSCVCVHMFMSILVWCWNWETELKNWASSFTATTLVTLTWSRWTVPQSIVSSKNVERGFSETPRVLENVSLGLVCPAWGTFHPLGHHRRPYKVLLCGVDAQQCDSKVSSCNSDKPSRGG